jgi:methylase of polypeptide subunit release factors
MRQSASYKRRGCEERFQERYALPTTKAALIVEREAIGANVGANGFTTLAQADLLANRLMLRPEHRVLDVGCGRGWPGIYLAQKVTCKTVLIDLPPSALASAVRRSDKLRQGARVSVLRGSAVYLPFAARSFDGISHTDTL